jgi:hypothetical protein
MYGSAVVYAYNQSEWGEISQFRNIKWREAPGIEMPARGLERKRPRLQ